MSTVPSAMRDVESSAAVAASKLERHSVAVRLHGDANRPRDDNVYLPHCVESAKARLDWDTPPNACPCKQKKTALALEAVPKAVGDRRRPLRWTMSSSSSSSSATATGRRVPPERLHAGGRLHLQQQGQDRGLGVGVRLLRLERGVPGTEDVRHGRHQRHHRRGAQTQERRHGVHGRPFGWATAGASRQAMTCARWARLHRFTKQ